MVSLRNYAARCISSCVWLILDQNIILLGSMSLDTFLGNDFAHLLPIFMILLHKEYKLSPQLVVLASLNLQGLLELLDASMKSLHAVMRHGSLVTAAAGRATYPSKRFPYSLGPLNLRIVLLEELGFIERPVKAGRLRAYRLIHVSCTY